MKRPGGRQHNVESIVLWLRLSAIESLAVCARAATDYKRVIINSQAKALWNECESVTDGFHTISNADEGRGHRVTGDTIIVLR
jgi:hypothetical protein